MEDNGSGGPRIGIVHERLTDVAGSEAVVEQLAQIWPSAPVLVPFSRPEGIPKIDPARVINSWLQLAYSMLSDVSYAPLLPLVPPALKGTVSREHRDHPLDALVISHHAFAVAGARPDIPSLAYVHSPARWAWDKKFREGETTSSAGREALSVLGALAKSNEKASVGSLDAVVANSSAVRSRIQDWWGRDATVVHPPVNVDYFNPGSGTTPKGEYFISVGRLVPYKRVDIAVQAAVRAKARLVVVGDGRDAKRIQPLADANPGLIELRGFLPDDEVRHLVQRARALIMPGEEDFGIVPVEATASGTPVIALAKGGALDSVIDGVTGVHVPEGATEDETISNFADALRSFNDNSFACSTLLEHAAKFSRPEFRRRMDEALRSILEYSR